MDTPDATPDDLLPLATPTPTLIDAADAVVLNVLSPSSEVPGGRITFPRIHLDTKLSQLKIRIRNALPAAPAPERQRLIYRGHALLNADATLRQVLRPQASAEAHSDVYTLHLVLPPGSAASANPTSTQSAVRTGQAGLPQPPTQPPTQPAIPNGLPQPPGVQLPHNVFAQAQAAQMMLQNQLDLIQLQLAGHNHQHQHGHGDAHTLPNTGMPDGMQITYGIRGGQPGQQAPNMPLPAGFSFGHPIATNFEALIQQQHQLMQHPAIAGRQPMPIAGQMVANQPGAGIPGGADQETAATIDTSDTNGPNITGQSPLTTRVHETIGPQGQRIRTVVRESMNLTISRHDTPNSASRPASGDAGRPPPQRTASPNSLLATMPGINLQRPPPQNASPAPTQPHLHSQPTRHTPMSFMMPPPMPTASASPSTTMAWVLSSPTGPEALLFAPGHGLFSSAPQTSSVWPIPTRIGSHRAAVEASAAVAQAAVAAAAPPQPGQVPVAQPLARLPHPNAVPDAQLAEENEFFNFIVGRGWLFMRLYVFTCFISEPNTWRRYLLLSLITIVVFLPRDNLLQRGIAQVRRHVDTLIGPPAPPARDAPVQANADGAAAPGGAQPVAANPTPAESAARLLREHEARNPNAIRDVLFRVERAVAMFVASLVPGVGERHVRAREDQRREAGRLENENEEDRRNREEAERAIARIERSATTPVGTSEAGSTAVEARDEAEEARERTTRGQAVEAEA
jgi:hypothetical protein